MEKGQRQGMEKEQQQGWQVAVELAVEKWKLKNAGVAFISGLCQHSSQVPLHEASPAPHGSPCRSPGWLTGWLTFS